MTGWGPDRPIYRDNTFPDSLTFNSTYDNEILGDERNWVRAKPAADPNAEYSDSVEVTGGEEYVVMAYVRLDGPVDQTANDAKLMFNVPNCTGHRVGIFGYLHAVNTFPREVYDGVEFWARDDFNLAVVPDSARMISNHSPAPGMPISTLDLVTSTGVHPALDSADGQMRPGYAEARYVEFRVLAQGAGA